MSMEFFEVEVLRSDLQKVISMTLPVVEKRNIISILGCIKISAYGNSLKFSVTNDTILLEYSINARIIQEGTIATDAITFANVIRKISDPNVCLVYTDNQLKVAAKGCSFNLNVLSADKFPSFMLIDNPISNFTIHGKDLYRLTRYTEFAMLNNENRHNLHGVFISANSVDDKSHITAAATDGHRLSTLSDQIEKCNDFETIIPVRLVRQINNVFNDEVFCKSNVRVKIDSAKIELVTEHNLSIVSKLVNAKFPEYTNLIPNSNNNILRIHSNLLAESIDRVMVVSSEKFRAIKFYLSSNQIKISAYSEIRGYGQQVISCNENEDITEISCYYKGQDMVIGFNAKYILDILDSTKNSIVDIYFNTPVSPILVKCNTIETAKFVVMPVKV